MAARQAEAAIRQVSVQAYRIPTDAPEADGTLSWDSTTLVLVHVQAGGCTGLGYTYADAATATLVHDKLIALLVGQDAMAISGRWRDMVREVRNLGRPGIASMAISAADNALWDLKGKLLGLPLATLLGMAHPAIPVYGSGGFTSYTVGQLQQQLGDWARSGMRFVKMKIGSDPAVDVERVRAARAAIGPDTQLFMDANGAYRTKQALAFAENVRGQDVTWFEEPVSSDDLAGLRLLRERVPFGMAVSAGEYGYDLPYFRRMLEAGAVDILQADATRCGGITGFLGVAALCEAFGVPLSSHCAPALHLPVCCSVRPALHLEYFHDHARIEQMLFDGAVMPKNGELAPDMARPGLGIEFKEKDAECYRIS